MFQYVHFSLKEKLRKIFAVMFHLIFLLFILLHVKMHFIEEFFFTLLSLFEEKKK